MRGGAYLRDTTVLLTEICLQQCPCMEGREDLNLNEPKYNQHLVQSELFIHQERIRIDTTRVRACNYVKIKTGRNFPPVLKIVTRTAQVA